MNIVSVNFTLTSDTDDGAAVVPNIEVRMGNGSGARENALCEWVGRIQLVSRRQRNFVFESCNGVGRDGPTVPSQTLLVRYRPKQAGWDY